MHDFNKLREKAQNAYGAHNSSSAASSTQVTALLNLAEAADALLEELDSRNITGQGSNPYPGRSRRAWDLGTQLRLRLERVEHLSEVTR